MKLDKKLEKRLAESMEHIHTRALEELSDHADRNRFQSPIEAMLYTELLISKLSGYGPVEIRPQVKQGKYSIDIAAYYIFGDEFYKVAVECDGHDYHERTEAQARRDKNKDRFLQSEGWLVARFTGKEIYHNAEDCADKVHELVQSIDFSKWNKANG